jgi:hypothetical protein
MSPSIDLLDFYMQPAPMSAAGRHVACLDLLPDDLPVLVRIVQGLVLHEFTAWVLHGVKVPEARRQESHLRSVEQMLGRILQLDDRPLYLARPAPLRLVGVCHHFALLLVAMLRAKGIPARARWGFGAYFNPPCFEDHVVCETWLAREARWTLVEAQIDEAWQAQPGFDFDILDVSPDRFLVAADAWTRCRAGLNDPSQFGIFAGNLRGQWFIARSLLKDAAALVKQESLPWDVWGAMPHPGEILDHEQLAFFDHLADLTRSPDDSLPELRKLFSNDRRAAIPATVYNAVTERQEAFEPNALTR